MIYTFQDQEQIYTEIHLFPKRQKIGMLYLKISEEHNHLENFEDFWIETKKSLKITTFSATGNHKLRLRCSSLGSDLYRNHLSNNDTCMYCNCPETAEHYLLHCRKFYNERTLTIHEINVATNVDTSSKGCPMYDDITNRDIFSAVQEYIRLTKRFDT